MKVDMKIAMKIAIRATIKCKHVAVKNLPFLHCQQTTDFIPE
jgi:hypothetical protein